MKVTERVKMSKAVKIYQDRMNLLLGWIRKPYGRKDSELDKRVSFYDRDVSELRKMWNELSEEDKESFFVRDEED